FGERHGGVEVVAPEAAAVADAHAVHGWSRPVSAGHGAPGASLPGAPRQRQPGVAPGSGPAAAGPLAAGGPRPGNRGSRAGGRAMPVLVVGTRNRKKHEEILEILGDLGLELRDLTAYPDAPEVVEDGTTFEANSRKKAVELARRLGQWVLGEDSGLVVPGLGG